MAEVRSIYKNQDGNAIFKAKGWSDDDETSALFIEYMQYIMNNISIDVSAFANNDHATSLYRFNEQYVSQEQQAIIAKDFSKYVQEKKPAEAEKILQDVGDAAFGKKNPFAPLMAIFNDDKKDQVNPLLDELAVYLASEVYGAADTYDLGIQKKVFGGLGFVGSKIAGITPGFIKKRIPEGVKTNAPKAGGFVKKFLLGGGESPDERMKDALKASGLFDEEIYDYDELLKQFKSLGREFKNEHNIKDLMPAIGEKDKSEKMFVIFKTIATILIIIGLVMTLLSLGGTIASLLGLGKLAGGLTITQFLPSLSFGGALSHLGLASALAFIKNTAIGMLLTSKVTIPSFFIGLLFQNLLPKVFTLQTSTARRNVAEKIWDKKGKGGMINLKDLLQDSIMQDKNIKEFISANAKKDLKSDPEREKAFKDLNDRQSGKQNRAQVKAEMISAGERKTFILNQLENYCKLVGSVVKANPSAGDPAKKFFNEISKIDKFNIFDPETGKIINQAEFNDLKSQIKLNGMDRKVSDTVVNKMKEVGDEFIKTHFILGEDKKLHPKQQNDKLAQQLIKFIDINNTKGSEIDFLVIKSDKPGKDYGGDEEIKNAIEFLKLHANACKILAPHKAKEQKKPQANQFAAIMGS